MEGHLQSPFPSHAASGSKQPEHENGLPSAVDSIMFNDTCAEEEEEETQEHLQLLDLLSKYGDDQQNVLCVSPMSSTGGASSSLITNIVGSVDPFLTQNAKVPVQEEQVKYPHLQSQLSQDLSSLVSTGAKYPHLQSQLSQDVSSLVSAGDNLFSWTAQENVPFDPFVFDPSETSDSGNLFQPVQDSLEWAQHFGISSKKPSTSQSNKVRQLTTRCVAVFLCFHV